MATAVPVVVVVANGEGRAVANAETLALDAVDEGAAEDCTNADTLMVDDCVELPVGHWDDAAVDE